MRRPGRLLVRALLGLAGVVLALALILFLAGDWIYPRVLESVARSSAGLALTTRGPVSVQWWPAPGVTAADLGVAPLGEASWDLEVKRIQLGLERHALLRGKLKLESVEVSGAHVRSSRTGVAESFESDILVALTRASLRIDDARIEIEGQKDQGHGEVLKPIADQLVRRGASAAHRIVA